MKRTLILLVSFAFLVAMLASLGVFAGDAPDTVKLDAKNGAVTFPHKKHAEELKIDCTKCHHTTKEGETPGKCTACHGTEDGPKLMKIHNVCKDCHKQMNADEGKSAPTGCKDCHVK